MNINLTNNPFVLPAKKVPSTEILPVGISNRTKPPISEPQTIEIQNNITRPERSKNLFTLSPQRRSQLSGLENRESDGKSTNRSISQYIETKNLARREAIESLVGLDILV